MKTIEELNKELNSASQNNNLETVKYLIEKGATNLNNALFFASKNNNTEMVNFLKLVITVRSNNIPIINNHTLLIS